MCTLCSFLHDRVQLAAIWIEIRRFYGAQPTVGAVGKGSGATERPLPAAA
jgi:hypothetical protein